jgi:cytochrome P450
LILTSDPDNIKAILATQFQDYGKGKPLYEEWKEFLGDSIFATDGELWHASRQLIRPLFVKDRVSDLHTFETHVKTLIEAIANGGVLGAPGTALDGIGRGRTVDISDLFFRYTLDAATEFLLGRSVDSLVTLSQPFAAAFAEAQRLQIRHVRTGYVLTTEQEGITNAPQQETLESPSLEEIIPCLA